jgi:hypothetical protein
MRRPAMLRKGGPAILGLLALGTILIPPAAAQAQDAEPAGVRLRPSLGFEYFSRTVLWDEDASASTLTAALAFLRAELEFRPGGRIGLFAGYSFSNYNGLIFRGLPFSVDYQAGTIGSLVWGGDFEERFATLGDVEIGVQAQFMMSLARTKDFEMPSLNVTSSLEGKGTWSRILAGPVVRYTGYENFTPYLCVSYNRTWGTFTMTEAVGELGGTEEKKILARGPVAVVIGTVFEPLTMIKIKAQLTAVPFRKLAGGLETDYTASATAVFSF